MKNNLFSSFIKKIGVGIYFFITFMLIVAEILENKLLIIIIKPLLIPTLIIVYISTSITRNYIYILCLLFALFSNILLLSEAQNFIFYGLLAFMIFRILTIIIVIKLIEKIFKLAFFIACLPFIFIFSCLINMTLISLENSIYPVIINGLLITGLAGISLSSYVMEDNRANSWLAISTLLSIVLVFLFMIQRFYLPNSIFQPISALIFSASHYTFYKFVLEKEKLKELEN